jgi:hypothetical protein
MFFVFQNPKRNECNCGNSFDKYAKAENFGLSCNLTCIQNETQICGGSNANSIYKIYNCKKEINLIF